MSECAVIPPLRQKSFCVRTQIAKTGYLPAEYIPHTFWLVPPSPFCAGSSWGLLLRKIFLIFIFFRFRYRTRLIFAFWLYAHNFDFHLLILTRFSYVWLSSSTRLILLNIYSFMILVFDYEFWLASISTCFSIVDSTLLLIINKHLCLCKVWLILVLAILSLSDVFLFVLGVVYRLGIK